MRGNDTDSRHLTVEELAEREGVPVKTIYKWNGEGTGPRYLRVGIHCRYRLSDVLAWEKSRVVDSRPAARR
jgi:excisionase family DNA binding protein